MTSVSERHNKISSQALHAIVKPAIEAGDSVAAVLVILESVAAGVLTACARLDNWDEATRDSMLIALEDGVRKRLATIPIKKG